MTLRQKQTVEEALIAWIERVAENKITTPEEVTALPEVVTALVRLHESN